MPYCYDYPHPAVTVDIVALRRHAGTVELLLIRRRRDPYRNRWALPGGFVNIDEDLDEAARREFAEETGLAARDLQQLRTFGRPDRDPRERVISVAYTAWLAGDDSAPRAGSDAAAARWFTLDDTPPLAFDHAEIIALARHQLRRRSG